MNEDAPQREHALRDVFNRAQAIEHIAQWRMMPSDLPPQHTVCQQTRRWRNAGVFEALVNDLRMLIWEMTHPAVAGCYSG